MIMKPEIKGLTKCVKISARRSIHNLLFCAHTPWMNKLTETFLLVSSSVTSKQQMCSVFGQGQTSEEHKQTKNVVPFHNH